jgi:GH15 family glucan-1,4-alpha-glucosidase
MKRFLDARSPRPQIRDYAAIGDTRSVALVALNGSIDWFCYPRLDSHAVFASLIDCEGAGFLQVSLDGPFQTEQSYIEKTNVVVTCHKNEIGQLEIHDYMPIRKTSEDLKPAFQKATIIRKLSTPSEDVTVKITLQPRCGFASQDDKIILLKDNALVDSECCEDLAFRWSEGEFEVKSTDKGDQLVATINLKKDCPVFLIIGPQDEIHSLGPLDCEDFLQQTIEAWWAWLNQETDGEREWAGRYAHLVRRSELVLKLMTYCETGAIAAAPTTSLPESLDGDRNWDYRYAWLRDAAMTAQALITVGHKYEAMRFLKWIEATSKKHQEVGYGLRIMYAIDGDYDISEKETQRLSGYKGVGTVRIGNEAYDQVQHDIYGELIAAAYELHRSGEKVSGELTTFLEHVANEAAEVWREPDHGIWEVRGGKLNYAYSKLMCWVAMDRAIGLHEEGVIKGDVKKWQKTRAEIKEYLYSKTYSQEKASFIQAEERHVLDASALLMGIQECISFDDPRMQNTVQAIQQELMTNGVVYRYRFDDGLAGEEGAFFLCSFWLVDALALSGRLSEAEALFDSLAAKCNHVGLYSEQLDPYKQEFLGNFPQAFSHLGLINSALYLSWARKKQAPHVAPIGSERHRIDKENQQHLSQ